jgi:hypothetical protein
MSGSTSLLNADMATLMRWARVGFQWWRDELMAMLPARLRGTGKRQGPVALFRPGAPLRLHRGNGLVEDLRAGERERPLDVAVPASLSLQRDIVVPAMSRSDLQSYIALEAERLLPLGGDSLLVDAVALERSDDGRMTIRLAALYRQTADEALGAAREAKVVPVRLRLAEDTEPQQTRFDFAPALRAEGTLPGVSARRQIWWALVGFALLANVALLIWRDQQDVTRLQAVVDEQQPAVAVYRTISGRAQRTAQLAETTVERRRNHNALADLAAATAALPNEAWAQRYAWDGRTLRVSGYMHPVIDVIAGLRKERRFANVRSTTGDVTADLPVGRPFDVTADLRSGQ